MPKESNEKTRTRKLNELITGLCATFDREFNPVLVSVFDKALDDLSIDEIDSAVSKWVSVIGKKFPTPVDLRELVLGDPASRATTALETLKLAMRQTGSYRSIAFADPALAVVIEHHGGWPEICLEYVGLRDRDVGYWEHEFKTVYQQALKTSRKPRGRHLVGLAEAQNTENLGSFTRGTLAEPEVDFYGIGETPRRLLLSEIDPEAKLVAARQKQLAEVSES